MVAAIDPLLVLLGLAALAFVALVVCIVGAVHEAVAERRARPRPAAAPTVEPATAGAAVEVRPAATADRRAPATGPADGQQAATPPPDGRPGDDVAAPDLPPTSPVPVVRLPR